MHHKHLFGPVLSRRLGYSLGLDLVPYKYCPLNCVYCEVQRTTNFTLNREEFFPLNTIVAELDNYLDTKPSLDYITFSGAGEPTLYSRIGEVIAHIKQDYPAYKLALLTNGVLLGDAGLRREILPCDLILPSLDACTQVIYEKINRPLQGLTSQALISGLIDLRREYTGMIWLELFIIEGLNDTELELDCLATAIQSIRADRVQINSLDRPGAEPWVKAARESTLLKAQARLGKQLGIPVEIIAKTEQAMSLDPIPADTESELRTILSRRPCTAEELATMLGMHINEITKSLRILITDHKVVAMQEQRGVFYTWIQ